MKPKRDLTIILLAAGVFSSGIAIAEDLYENGFGGDTVNAVCTDWSYYYKDAKKVFTRHYFSVRNDTAYPQQLTVTYTGCFDTGKCEQKTHTVNLAAWQFYVSNPDDYYHDFNNRSKGKYHFTSITDVNGYKNMHAQKTCTIDVIGN